MLKKIISGGQTGADIAGVRAGKAAGLETGGWMPKGFRTEAGSQPHYADLYGMRETPTVYYGDRTRRNAQEADATLIISIDPDSPGTVATVRAVIDAGKWYHMEVVDKDDIAASLEPQTERIARSIAENGWETLNIAGNRFASLERPVEAWLTEVFRQVKARQSSAP